jgi:transcriptional regulator with XRE-family HTH domain
MAESPFDPLTVLRPYCLGTKLRALRTKRRLILNRLAAQTGLSTALLSKLETDRMIPTLPTLASICMVYGVGLSHFFGESEVFAVSITRKAHLHGEARTSSVSVTPLTAVTRDSKLISQMIEIEPGPSLPLCEPHEDTSAFISVLEGRLQFSLGAGITEVLEPGDCVHIETRSAVYWSAANKHRCRILVVRPSVSRLEADSSDCTILGESAASSGVCSSTNNIMRDHFPHRGEELEGHRKAVPKMTTAG